MITHELIEGLFIFLALFFVARKIFWTMKYYSVNDEAEKEHIHTTKILGLFTWFLIALMGFLLYLLLSY
jgi:hypothetical protein